MTDAKLETLYQNYKGNGSVRYLSERIEELKKRAVILGAGTSLAIFFANETARFTLRSPLFRLKPIPALLVLLGPTAFFKYRANGEANQDVEKIWRIHKTREELGRDRPKASFRNAKLEAHHPLILTGYEALLGADLYNEADIEGIRTNHNIFDFPNIWDSVDRFNMAVQFDVLERIKPFMPKQEDCKGGVAPVFNYQDNDSKWQYATADYDHMYADPPDSNFGPLVDHEVDEKFIWAFHRSLFNQDVVINRWLVDPADAATDSHLPAWSKKLSAVAWYTNEKYIEALEQMKARREFSGLQARLGLLTDRFKGLSVGEEQAQEAACSDFVKKAYDEKLVRDSSGVFIRDEPQNRLMHTSSEEEDRDFYEYMQKLQEYNADAAEKCYITGEKTKRGPLEAKLNRLVDVTRKAKGILNTKLDDSEIPFDKDYLKEKLDEIEESFKSFERPAEFEGTGKLTEDETLEKFGDALASANEFYKEIGFFPDFSDIAKEYIKNANDDFDYVDDLHDSYKEELSKTMVDKLFDQIPEHVHFDIKTPLIKMGEKPLNHYNPMRPKTCYKLHEYIKQDEYFREK